MMSIHYATVTHFADDPREFEIKVQDYLDQGYKPLGGPQVFRSLDDRAVLIQALTKSEPDTEEGWYDADGRLCFGDVAPGQG